MSLRDDQKRDKQRRILAAARALFRRRGFDKTTTREIAAKAGIGTGTLFLYAKTKEELLTHLFKGEIERVQSDAFTSMPAGPLLDQLTHLFGAFFDFYDRDKALARVFVKELAFLHGDAAIEQRSGDAEFMARVAALIEAARDRGEVRDDVAAMPAALNFFALYVFVIFGWLTDSVPEKDAATSWLRSAFALQLQGLVPGRRS